MRALLTVDLRINKRADAAVSMKIGLTGPGDITGIDGRLVVRTDPPNLTNDFEPNYFPSIEFDPPDFPWLFTPAASGPQGKLRPWLALVVVRKQDGVSLKVEPRTPLPVLRIAAPAIPALELPDLADSWGWAHAQVATSEIGKPMADLLAAESPLNLSRLVCPRRLEPGRRYLACVVPTFESGRKAGLGLPFVPTDEQGQQPAWSVGLNAPGEVKLPVYYHWEFGTGQSGDFEALVRLLEARPIPPGLGVRPMIVNDPAFGLPALGAVSLEGALRPADFEPVDPENMAAFHAGLRGILNLSETQLSGREDPVVAPSIYGRWQASVERVPEGGKTPHWLRELNLDPRLRAVAGFGTLVVQDQQEALMASAWEQLGDRRANQILRQSQLAREVGMAILGKHLKPLAETNPDRLFQITALVHGRIRISRTTLLQEVRQSGLPQRALSASFRRIVRPSGPVGRKIAPASRRQTLPVVRRLAVGQIQARIAAKPPAVVVSPAALQAHILSSQIASPVATRFRQASQTFQEYLTDTRRLSGIPETPVVTAAGFAAMQTKLLAGLDPRIIFAKRVEEQIERRPSAASESAVAPKPVTDPLAEFTTAPQFPQPMYEALRDLSQDLLLPGLERIPPNTVALLETNTRFVEAFMVGLNHEMSRELLWREFPTDQRETCFRRFWDDTGTPNGRDAGSQFDPIHQWPAERHLGENFKSSNAGEHLVLLIRGELLQRYPSASIYAVRAERGDNPARRKLGQEERFPLFHGTLKPDVTFFGFPLTAEEALGALDEKGKPAASGDPGWFFVIQQQPTEPRFGLDLPSSGSFGAKPVTSWNEASWAHLVETEAGLAALTHAPLAGRLGGHEVASVTWGFNSAHMAAATLQQPVRIAIHASALLEQRAPLQPEA